jgi:hypothetical protein
MKAKAKLLVNCPMYNRTPNVLFMMDADDFRLHDARFSKDYVVLAPGKYDRKAKTLTTENATYTVFPDWSLRKQ